MTNETTTTTQDAQPKKDSVQIAEATAGKTLLQALLTEVRLLQKPWQNTPEAQQRDVIGRLRTQVEEAVKVAVHQIAGNGMPSLTAHVESVMFKDGIKATLKLARGNPVIHELADAEGSAVMIIITDTAQHTDDMHTVKPDPDQKSLLPETETPAPTPEAQPVQLAEQEAA